MGGRYAYKLIIQNFINKWEESSIKSKSINSLAVNGDKALLQRVTAKIFLGFILIRINSQLNKVK